MSTNAALLYELENWGKDSLDKVLKLVTRENVNIPTQNGYTVLGFVVSYNQTDDVRRLLEMGADPHLATDEGYDAFWCAQETNVSLDIKRLLVIGSCRQQGIIEITYELTIEQLIDKLETLLIIDENFEYNSTVNLIERHLSFLAPDSDPSILDRFIKSFSGDQELGALRDSIQEASVIDEAKVASQFIGVPLTPFCQYRVQSSLHRFPATQLETYYRSTKGPVSTFLKAPNVQYGTTEIPKSFLDAKHVMKSSKVANFGLYRHPFESGNSKGSVSPNRGNYQYPQPTLKQEGLYDTMILYKRKSCEEVSTRCTALKNLTVGYYKGYPCLMVRVNNIFEREDENYLQYFIEFLISYFIGKLNFQAASKNLDIEIVRRSSFGFISPGISEISPSFRIEVGITPQEYLDVIVSTLIRLDEVLTLVAEDFRRHDLDKRYPLPNDHFTKSSAEYKKYMGTLAVPNVSHYLALCFEKCDRGSGIAIKNALRSYGARFFVSALTFNGSKANTTTREDGDLLLSTLVNALSNIRFKNNGITCVVPDVSYALLPRDHAIIQCKRFWPMITSLYNTHVAVLMDYANRKLTRTIILDNLAVIRQCIDKQFLLNLYYSLDKANALLFANSVSRFRSEHVLDFYGSDSEEEGLVQDIPIYAKKIIVRNGTRAILSSLEASAKDGKVRLDNVYYEIKKTTANCTYATFVKNVKDANHLVTDLTPCIPDARTYKPTSFPLNLQVFILDTTSSTQAECRAWLKVLSRPNVKYIFFVSSGFKNEQMGSDINPYGTIRLFSKDKAGLEAVYRQIKEIDSPIRSGVAHLHRRVMKSMGATMRNRDILHEPIPQEDQRDGFDMKALDEELDKIANLEL